MKYYHATKRLLQPGDTLLTKTGRADGNILNGGAVFFTSDIKSCKRYGSFVFEIKCKKALDYKTALKQVGRTKKARYTRNVFVACPADTIIVRQLT